MVTQMLPVGNKNVEAFACREVSDITPTDNIPDMRQATLGLSRRKYCRHLL